MSEILDADELFFERAGMDSGRVGAIVSDALDRADDGELFLEHCQSESLVFDDGRLASASFNTEQGFGLRGVSGEATGYAHASELSEEAISRAAETVRAVRSGHAGSVDVGPRRTNRRLYGDVNPALEMKFAEKVALLQNMDSYARSLDARVTQFSASISGERQVVRVMRAGGESRDDVRPLVRVNVTVVCADGDRIESGSHGVGGRTGYAAYVSPDAWQAQIDEALRQALANLEAVPAPAGEMDVVLGPGWPGILLHEAIGHGLEGDFNRKKTSAFAGLMGERVATKGVTVVDDGTINDRRGSLSIDDEGTPSSKTVLIEDGILTGYMQDRMNGRLMRTGSTGNGRRQGFAHVPMPRMTNTYMLNGERDSGEILGAVGKGLYAVNFGGGQVDITSGKFVFSASEAYLIEDGKVGAPVKGATLIGNGPDVLTRVRMVGNDLSLDPGVGTCGKEGQGVPVGVGQPTLLVENLTVGGTAA